MRQTKYEASRVVVNSKRYYDIRRERQTRYIRDEIKRPVELLEIRGRFPRRFIEKIIKFSKICPIRSRKYLKTCKGIVRSEEKFLWMRVREIFEIETRLQEYHQCVYTIETRIDKVEQDQKKIQNRICQFLSLEDEEKEEDEEDAEEESNRKKLSAIILDEWPEIVFPTLCTDPMRLKEAFLSLFNRMELVYFIGIMVDYRWDKLSKALSSVKERTLNLNYHLNKIEKNQEWLLKIFSLPKYELLSVAANSNSEENTSLQILHHRFLSGRSH